MVYVVTDGSGFVKIGFASDYYRRVTVLQTGNPRLIKLLMTIETDSLEQDKKLEKILHNKFAKYRVEFSNGAITEWFSDDVLDYLSDKTMVFWNNISKDYGFDVKLDFKSTESRSVIGKKRESTLKTTMKSVDLYSAGTDSISPPKKTTEETRFKPTFKPGDVVTTKRNLVVGKMYSGFSFSRGMGVWRAVVCSVHEWEYGFYYMLDNKICYSEEMLEVYEPWKKKPIEAQAV